MNLNYKFSIAIFTRYLNDLGPSDEIALQLKQKYPTAKNTAIRKRYGDFIYKKEKQLFYGMYEDWKKEQLKLYEKELLNVSKS